MIPLPELIAELAVGIGAALFGANLLVLIRPPRTDGDRRGRPARPPSMTRIYVNMAIGAVVALLGLASLLRSG